MKKLKKKLEYELMVGNYELLFYSTVDSKNNFIQLAQIYSQITDELVYEEKIINERDVSRIIRLIYLMFILEKQHKIHFKNYREFSERMHNK